MNTQDMLNRALIIAVEGHKEQTDKGGLPYILHPLAVMNSCKEMDQKIVAVLHDVVEDTDITLTRLKLEGFCPSIVNAVEAITHLPNEPREKYWDRVVQDKIASRVKLEDIEHNLKRERLMQLDIETQDRLIEK